MEQPGPELHGHGVNCRNALIALMTLITGMAPEPTPEVFSLNKEKGKKLFFFSFFSEKKKIILKARIETGSFGS